jgi:hypothetical protein
MTDTAIATIYRGLPFSLPVRLATRNDEGVKAYTTLTGFEIFAQGIVVADDESVPVGITERQITFTVTISVDQLGSNQGLFTLSLTAEQTAALDPGARIAFDIIVKDTGDNLSPPMGPRFLFVRDPITGNAE